MSAHKKPQVLGQRIVYKFIAVCIDMSEVVFVQVKIWSGVCESLTGKTGSFVFMTDAINYNAIQTNLTSDELLLQFTRYRSQTIPNLSVNPFLYARPVDCLGCAKVQLTITSDLQWVTVLPDPGEIYRFEIAIWVLV